MEQCLFKDQTRDSKFNEDSKGSKRSQEQVYIYIYIYIYIRQRNNILWYNPPFSKNVNTNIGHRFLTLVDKHFPKENKLRKIFNRNTIKISYSCMNNTKQIIDNHNKHILNASKHR